MHRELIDLKDTVPHDGRALQVNQTLCMDLVGPLPLSKNRNKYILTLFDHFSRFVVTVQFWTSVQRQCAPASTPGG